MLLCKVCNVSDFFEGKHWATRSSKVSNTIDDDFSFTEEEIFVGCHPHEFDEMASDSESECEAIIDFPKKIFTKSCITHSKLDLERYCLVCKETFTEEFEPDLFNFSRKDSNYTGVVQ